MSKTSQCIVLSNMGHVKHIIVSCSDLESSLLAPSHRRAKLARADPARKTAVVYMLLSEEVLVSWQYI